MDDEILIKSIGALQQTDGKKEPHILKARLKHVRSYIQWSSNEDQILTELHKKNHTIDFMAKSLGRSNNSIEERLKFLESNLEKKYGNKNCK